MDSNCRFSVGRPYKKRPPKKKKANEEKTRLKTLSVSKTKRKSDLIIRNP